jgi:amidase
MSTPKTPISSHDRRTFLKTTAIAGVAAMLTPAIAAEPFARPPAFELDEITIADLKKGLASGKFTARILTEKYLARIQEIDKRGPAVNAIIELNPDALQIADHWTRSAANRAGRCTASLSSSRTTSAPPIA